MGAIAGSLLAPPVPSSQPEQPPQPASVPDGQQYQQMPAAEYVPPSQPPLQYTPSQQQFPQPSPGIPGQYPNRMNSRPPAYQGSNIVHPQPYINPNAGGTTVVVQQDRPGYAGDGMGDFGAGLLLDGALGTVTGASLSHHHGGWAGGGDGWGGGGGWAAGPQIHDTDVTINNYYDNDTSVVNNNLDLTNNAALQQDAPWWRRCHHG